MSRWCVWTQFSSIFTAPSVCLLKFSGRTGQSTISECVIQWFSRATPLVHLFRAFMGAESLFQPNVRLTAQLLLSQRSANTFKLKLTIDFELERRAT
jgi:hypothetical protein